MNLFTETLVTYLKSEWDRVMRSPEGIKEARFIIESLSPQNTLDLFDALEEHRIEALQNNENLLCYFRAATGLWREWERRGNQVKIVDKIKNQHWIDQEDQQTYYRNATLPKNCDGLVVVLVGLNHASDQGSLSDFHLLDELRVWNLLGESYMPWLEKIRERFKLEATDSDIEFFDNALHELFKVRPRRLARLAEFFDSELLPIGSQFDTLTEVIDSFYEKLPFWDIPPILSSEKKKKNADIVKRAENFISHRNFKTPIEQKKAWGKLFVAFNEDKSEVPAILNGQQLYKNKDAYLQILHAFIFDADAEAKKSLMQTDIYPVLEILKAAKKSSKNEKEKIKAFSGSSVDVMLQALWFTWCKFEAELQGPSFADAIKSVRIVVECFYHDLNDDPDLGRDGDGLAKELLMGCLGGLPNLFSDLDVRLPVDADQELLVRDHWTKIIPVSLELDMDKAGSFGTSRERPHVQFRVEIEACDSEQSLLCYFKWNFSQNHPERVRYSCARNVIDAWPLHENGKLVLPAFQLPTEVMTALYFAADEEEANRLVSQALSAMTIINLVDDMSATLVDMDLWNDLRNLISAYRVWLQSFVDDGYYFANRNYFLSVEQSYESFVKRVLDRSLRGAESLLRRFYKAFLLVDEFMQPNDAYLRSAAAWGISPPVLELSDAQARFLRDSFPEIVAEQAVGGNSGVSFDRLMNLVEIKRPLAALVVDAEKKLSADVKSFGLLHHLGTEPSSDISLAVQILLRDEEIEEDVADILRPTEDSEVVVRVLRDYQQLYPFAEDGLRILAVHVENLATVLSGVDRFLRDYLKTSPSNWQPFQCEVMVYSISSSPLAVEGKLALWRDHVMETYREGGRSVTLSVGHHFAPTREKMVKLLAQERRLYDVAFLLQFLAGELVGEAEPTLPFEYDFNSISKFPICEYPRPIQKGDIFRRQSLLSNRRLRIQTLHADLSARLRNPGNPNREHLVFGQIDYKPWQPVVEALHKKAQWVACIDPFVDKRLLGAGAGISHRKIVGFTSGLGAYGELNLSISTEQDTLTKLTSLVKGQLSSLMPFEHDGDFEAMAAKVVDEAEEIIGLASLRAVVGQGEKIREVVGFAAIHRALEKIPGATMELLLPVDSVMHWFSGSDVIHRPDLLQLSLILRDGDIPLIQATVIECKFAQKSVEHLSKASDQVHDGLSHLTQLFAPNRRDVPRVSFDRRYWWAQLHRAITSRSVVDLSESERQNLDSELERLAEGYYEISWKGSIFTFWVDEACPVPVLTPLALPSGVINPCLQVPTDFSILHVSMGYKGVMALFTKETASYSITFSGSAIRLRPVTDLTILMDASSREHPPSVATASAGGTNMIGSNEDSPKGRTSDGNETAAGSSIDIGAKATAIVAAAQPEPIVAETRPETLVQPSAGPVLVVDMAPLDTHVPHSIVTTLTALPSKLLIGTKSNGDPVYWHYGHPKLANRHMLIFGASGSGKTYGIQCLLAEMAKESLHSLIVDYTDGFLPNQVESTFQEVVKLKNNYVYTEKLPLNPFQPQKKIIDPALPAFSEKPFDVATRVASIFTSVFESMGDQQSSVLIRVLEAGIAEGENFSLDDILSKLRDDGSQSGESLANKLEPFVRSQPFREGVDSTWKEMLTSPEHWVNVLQLTGLARDIQKLVTEFALWNLYDYACNTGNKNRPIPVVLDEIQNLDHRSDSPIDKMLREGRKFGLSLILATQTTSQFDQEQRDRLFQAGHKLFFKPAASEIPSFAALLSVATGESKAVWGERLSKLEKGQCWSFGPALTSSGALKELPMLVSVTPLEDRGFDVG
jgi:DNA phosphorothioation-dependent restriction protein DptH